MEYKVIWQGTVPGMEGEVRILRHEKEGHIRMECLCLTSPDLTGTSETYWHEGEIGKITGPLIISAVLAQRAQPCS